MSMFNSFFLYTVGDIKIAPPSEKCSKRDLMSYHQAEGIPAGRPLSPPDKFSIQAHFLFPKTVVFRQCYGVGLPFFS